MLAYGPSRRREGLAFIAFGKMTREERLEFAGETGVNVMDKAGTNDCLVVGFNMHPVRRSAPERDDTPFANTNLGLEFPEIRLSKHS
jgi:hypothetical protein